MTSDGSSVLVTGGAGYIGSHVVIELLAAGYDVCVIDNLCNSKASVLDRVERVAGRRPKFAVLDIRDRAGLRRFFCEHSCRAVIHCAGLKAVSESVEKPLAYYDCNVSGSITLVECMAEAGVKTIVFSSSATVYGEPPPVQFRENHPLAPVSPYGRSKLMVEQVLRDMGEADSAWRITLLRYFNPVGAHASGLIGEDPNGIPNNLMPYISQVAMGKLKELPVYGNDYPTADGSGVRDYIHVVDLARGHIAALDALKTRSDLLTLNLGTGRGYSVLEMLRAFSATCGRPVPHRVVERRAGDLAEYFSDSSLAFKTLGWRAQFGIDAMCRDTWRWQQWASENLT